MTPGVPANKDAIRQDPLILRLLRSQHATRSLQSNMSGHTPKFHLELNVTPGFTSNSNRTRHRNSLVFQQELSGPPEHSSLRDGAKANSCYCSNVSLCTCTHTHTRTHAHTHALPPNLLATPSFHTQANTFFNWSTLLRSLERFPSLRSKRPHRL